MTEDDFYQQRPGYYERVADNLAHWLGLQHLTVLDAFILVPLLVPLVAFLIAQRIFWHTSVLNWVWKYVAKAIIGPYLLCWALALWHLHADTWLVLLISLV